MPAALLEGYDLVLIGPDGQETQLAPVIADGLATFTLDLTAGDAPQSVGFLRLQPKA